MKIIRTIAFGIGVAALYGVPCMVAESTILARHQVILDGHTYNVSVEKDNTVGVQEESEIGANIQMHNGHLVAHTGIPAGYGHMPLMYDRKVTPAEEAIYHLYY